MIDAEDREQTADGERAYPFPRRLGAHYGDAAYQAANGVATDANDNIVITGSMSGVANFGGGALVNRGSADVFVAKFAAGGLTTGAAPTEERAAKARRAPPSAPWAKCMSPGASMAQATTELEP